MGTLCHTERVQSRFFLPFLLFLILTSFVFSCDSLLIIPHGQHLCFFLIFFLRSFISFLSLFLSEHHSAHPFTHSWGGDSSNSLLQHTSLCFPPPDLDFMSLSLHPLSCLFLTHQHPSITPSTIFSLLTPLVFSLCTHLCQLSQLLPLSPKFPSSFLLGCFRLPASSTLFSPLIS